MSRIGNKVIQVVDGVDVSLEGNTINIKGSKGEFSFDCPSILTIEVDQEAKQISVKRPNDTKKAKSLHGLARSIIANYVHGVSSGWQKSLEIVGIGYRGSVKGNVLNLSLGYSHPIEYQIPEGITIDMPANTKITVTGADKQLVGQVAANIRAYRKPEPYKGKGVRYSDEVIIKKEGKKAGK